MVEKVKRLVNSTGFNNLILVLIVISGALVGMETFPEFANDTAAGRVVDTVQWVILWCFVVEIALKVFSYGNRPWEYFTRAWNIFDFTVVAICFLPIHAQYAAVFRMARLLRTLRMVTILPRLQVLVGALLKSIPSLGYIGILLGLHLYVYAVAGTFLFRENDPQRFGSLHVSSLTLFQVLTLEGWNDILATQYNGSEAEYPDSWKEKFPLGESRENQPQPVIAAAYFVTFIMFGTMIMLNLFTGVIISSMEEASAERQEEVREEHLKEKGFLTLRDELLLLGQELHDMSLRVKGIELKEEAEANHGAAVPAGFDS